MNLLFVSAVIICLFVLIFVIKFEKGLSRWLGISALISLSWALYSIIFIAKLDRFQSVPQKIFYIHVPSAILGQSIFMFMAVCGFITMVWRVKISGMLLKSAAPIGASFTLLALSLIHI